MFVVVFDHLYHPLLLISFSGVHPPQSWTALDTTATINKSMLRRAHVFGVVYLRWVCWGLSELLANGSECYIAFTMIAAIG